MSLIRLLPDRRLVPDAFYSWLGYRFVAFRAEMTINDDSLDTVQMICNLIFKGRWGMMDMGYCLTVWGSGWCRDPWLFEQRVKAAFETATGGEVVTVID